MPKTIIRNTEKNIFFKDNKNNVYICCPTKDADRSKIEEAIENKKEYYEILEIARYIINIYKISNNSILSLVDIPTNCLSEGPYRLYTPSEFELKLYETLYKDFKKTIKYKKEKEVIQKIINDLLPVIHLLDNIKYRYHLHKNDIGNLIKSIFIVLSNSSKSLSDTYKIEQKIEYFTYYQCIHVNTNIEEKIIKDVFQDIMDDIYIRFNHYYDNNSNEIILIFEKPYITVNHIYIFTEHRLRVGKESIKINDAIVINKDKDQNIIEKLSKLIDKRAFIK